MTRLPALALTLLLVACGDKVDDTGAATGGGSGTDDTGADAGGGTEGSGSGETGADDTGEDCPDPQTFFYDADGDGYGDPDLSTEACTAPAGYVAVAEDCDDLRPDVHPDQDDPCNLEDDDCDGLVDEDAATSTWHADLDLDGWGDPDDTVESCQAPEGYVVDDSDCDDGDDAIHPGAEETCGDDIDSDCDGVFHTCLPEGEYALDFDAIKVSGTELGAHLAYRAEVADLDLDGQVDLILSSIEADSGSGVVHAWLGPITADTDASAAALTIKGVATDDQLGSALLGGHDWDGDGYADLLTGAWEAEASASDSGAVYWWAGPVTGGSFSSDGADEVFTGYGTSRLGADLVTGDFDGDGDTDVFIGTPNQITTAHTSAGAYLLTAPFDFAQTQILYAGTLTLAPNQKTLGAEALAAGDYDGDGVDDLVVSDELYTTSAAGVVYVLLGPTSSTARYWSDSGLSVSGSANDQLLGKALAMGDLDGDGYDDVLAGAPGDSTDAPGAGAVYLLAGGGGSMGTLSSAKAELVCDIEDAAFGSALEILEDLDQDGLPELLLSAPGEDDGAGTTWLYTSPFRGTLTADGDHTAMFNTSDYDGVGTSLRGAGDLTGDGLLDLVIGAPTDQASSEAGAGWVFPLDGSL